MAGNLNLPNGQSVASSLGNVVSNSYPFGYILDGSTGLSTMERLNLAIESAKTQQEVLANITATSWPNAIQGNDDFGTYRAFLPPILISPTIDGNPNADGGDLQIVTGKVGDYEWKDWTGQKLSMVKNLPKTEDRFKTHKDTLTNKQLIDERYSMRDFPLIFGDTRTDYFKFGLQTIDGLNPIENPENGDSQLRLGLFKGTPWEQSDPVYFGFDIIFDAVSSPLLNGSVLDFIANYSGVNEIASRTIVYDEFINQFTKFFRTNAKPRTLNPDAIAMTKTRPHFTGYADSVSNWTSLDENTKLFKPGKSAYFAHYIKKVSGLDLLIEANKGDTYKYSAEWKKDMIQISTTEDVTLSMGALAHLYKLLYWSRPHQKHLIPENLLRFNCDIIVSEVRNMNRIRKNKQTGNIEVLKDNLSRWVFSLRECQFYFDKLPIENDIDLGGDPKQYESFTFNIDFKYSSHRLERFVPSGDWGNYIGYDAGSIWKIGNKESNANRTGTSSMAPNPLFIRTGNTLNENGVTTPFVLSVVGDGSREEDVAQETSSSGSVVPSTSRFSGESGIASSESTGSTNAPVASLDGLKKSSEALEISNKEELKDIDALSKTSGLKPGGKIGNILSNKKIDAVKDLTSSVPKPTTSLLKGKSDSNLVNSKFFDVKGSLGFNPVESPKGSLDFLKSNFSEAKTQATSGFFDVRSNLKSSLTDGKKIISNIGNLNVDQLTSGLTEKVKSGVPSLDSIKTKFSEAKTQATSGFFDVRSNLKSSLTDGKKMFGNLNVDQLTSGLTEKVKSGVPSLDSIKTKFSEAKTQATSGFFDVRSNLKSSLTDGKKMFGNLNVDQLTSGLTEKVKSGVPSLDSLKVKFTEAKSQATTGFFDVRSNLKSSITKSFDGAGVPSLDSIKGKFTEAKSQATTGFFDVRSNLKSSITKSFDGAGVPSLDSVKTKFTDAKSQATTGFFDVRSNLKSSVTKSFDGAGVPSLDSLKGKFTEAKSQATTGFFDVRSNLKSSVTKSFDGAGVPSLDSIKTKFTDAKSQATSGFFDVRSNLESSVTKSFDGAGVPSLDSIKGKFTEAKSQATSGFFDVRSNLESSVTKSFDGAGVPSLDSVKTKFSDAKSQVTSGFFDVRSNLESSVTKSFDSGKSSVGEVQKGLLNNALNKVYGTPAKSPNTGKSNPPQSTSFFDLKGQLKDFLGGPLGDKLTGE